MTTITKERLQEVIDGDILFTDEQRELARIALASIEAEPVGYFYADKPGDWYQISDGDRVPSHRRIPLYANPQSSPVVKLPNEFFSSEGIVVQIEKLMAVLAVHGIQYERRGNACRAAMLQAGNSPVTPDGWVMVPKEMTDAIGEAIAMHANCCGGIALDIYDAMLAAAPQQ
ncbi:hypothetical protein [Citrobacter braakii]|uniref:hypothetical protein n=1 Tax=Citrobacter braakii TaxID=57706 RepID=UPI0039799034